VRFSLCTGTHRIPKNPEGTLARGRYRSDGYEHAEDALDQYKMPNLVEAALPAGSAIAFDSSIWCDNTSFCGCLWDL
jgi:hypothetical protein